MADDISKKVLIDISLSQQDAQASVQALKTDVDALKASIVANKAAIDSAKAATAELTTELTRGKVEQQQVKTAIDKARLSQIEANKATKEAKANMVAAKGSYDEAQRSLTALGRSIKSAEGGFKSTNPAIQAQIAQYKQLNSQLGAFDKKLGNHQRNVGNYEGALQGINNQLGVLIPGFGQFSSILQTATQGFNAMGTGAQEAETGMTGLSTASMITVGALAAVGVGVLAVIDYLTEFRNTGDQVKEFMGGLSEQFANFGKNIVDMFNNKDFNPLHLFKGFKDSFDKGIDISKLEIQAKHEDEITQTIIKQRQTQADEYRAMSKNRSLDISDREKYLKQAQGIEDEIIQKQTDNADLQIKLALDVAEKNKKLLAPTRKRLEKGEGDIETANYLANQGEITEKGYQMYKAALDKRDEALRNANLKKIRQQDDADNIQLKHDNTEISEMATVTEAYKKAMNDRIASIARTVQFSQESFAKELSTTQEHYRQLIFAQQKFIEEQEKIRDKSKSPKVKAQANKNISVAQGNITQLGTEEQTDIGKQVTDHYKTVMEATQKGQDELAALQIEGIKNVTQKQLAALDQRQVQEQQAYTKEQNLLSENITKLQAEITTAQGSEKAALQQNLDQQLTIQGINQDKSLQSQKRYEAARLEVIKNAADEELLIKDQTAVAKTQNVENHGSAKEELAAQQQQVLDEYNVEVSQKGLTDAKKLLLEQQYLNKRDALNKAYEKRYEKAELQGAQIVADATFTIIKQSMDRANQAFEVNLQRQRDHDLSNQALTETQKYIINEKYRKKEGAEKVKEFNRNKDLAILQAIINGAIAVTKAFADNAYPSNIVFAALAAAVTTAQVAVIASEKPPAYAKGGIHYDSDGKGGVLPGYSKKDNMNARLRSGEAVVVSEAMKDPWARNVVSAINQSYGGRSFDAPVAAWATPGFASGGVFTNYLPTSDNGLRPQININSSSRLHPDDIIGIAKAVSSMPPPVVDIKDVNYQQNRLSNVYDRLTY